MAMLDGMLAGLAESPAVKDAFVKLDELRTGVIQAMTHFNNRLDAIDLKQDEIIRLLHNPPLIEPAAPDGLMQILSESGQDMKMLQVTHESEIQNYGS